MKLTDLLARPVSAEEEEQIQELLGPVNQLREACEALSLSDLQNGLVRLAPLRLRSSSTLKRGEIESWQRANEYVAEKIRVQEFPNLQSILELNGLLRGLSTGAIRSQPVYVGTQQACPVAELTESLRHLEVDILGGVQEPVRKAALAWYWLVSLHPFEDANGRTAVLLADWILGLDGYLPLSFESKQDALVGIFENQRASATPGMALIKLLRNVHRSYQAVLG